MDIVASTSPSTAATLTPDLQKLTEVFYVVPHHHDDVERLAQDALDEYWQMRRCGESWDSVEVPQTFYSSDDLKGDMESSSKRVYKKLVFDLVGDILRDIYQDEEEVQPNTGVNKGSKPQQKYFKGRTPPTTLDTVRPIIIDNTLRCFGLQQRSQDYRTSKYSLRKKKDRVDEILVQELREEEPDWVNYDNDEYTVKMQLADSIFDSLLTETGNVMGAICQKRQANQS